MNIKSRLLKVVAVFAALTAAIAPAVMASTENISVPIDTVVWKPHGTVHTIKTVSVKNGNYSVTATSRNQHSVHSGTDLIVRSGNSAITIKDVERKEFITETATGTLNVADGKVSIQVKIGPDNVFSGGMDVVLKPIIKNITVCRPGTGVITIKETEKKSTDLDRNDAACKDIVVCRPGTGVITIKGYDKKSTDLDKDNVACKDIVVCRPGTGVITIKGHEKKSTDLDKDDVACQPKPELVKVCDVNDGKIKKIEKNKLVKGQHTTDLTKCDNVEVCDPTTGKITTVKKHDEKNFEAVDSDSCKEKPASKDPEVVPVELPKTGGIVDSLTQVLGATLTVVSAVAFYRSRQ